MRPVVLGVFTAFVGVALIVIGIAVDNDESGTAIVAIQRVDSTDVASSTSAASESASPSSASDLTTEVSAPPPSSTSAASTTASSASTTLTSSTTTPRVDADAVRRFVDEIGSWIAAGDAATLFDLLHPTVRERFGEELCRAWIDREVLALVDYQASGDPTGPTSVSVQTPAGPFDLDESWNVPVSYAFQGQAFDSVAQVGVLDGQLVWLGQCR